VSRGRRDRIHRTERRRSGRAIRQSAKTLEAVVMMSGEIAIKSRPARDRKPGSRASKERRGEGANSPMAPRLRLIAVKNEMTLAQVFQCPKSGDSPASKGDVAGVADRDP
jgi:hypothetical protein